MELCFLISVGTLTDASLSSLLFLDHKDLFYMVGVGEG